MATTTTRIPAEQFVKAFVKAAENGETTQDLAETLGVGYGSVSARAKLLRNKGVKLPKLARAAKTSYSEDRVSALNDLIKK